MATALDVVNEWAAENDDKQELVKAKPGLVLRWLNQAQLRFAEKSEVLRGTWNPTITSTGSIALPSDFLREFPDLVKYDVSSTDNLPLRKVDYPVAQQLSFGGTTHYSIYAGTFYVWSAAALTPSVYYVKKPAALTTLASDELTIPTEFHSHLVFYLDIMYDKSRGVIDSMQKDVMLQRFDEKAAGAGLRYKLRNDGLIKMRSGRF